tara:strand:- start:35 stop:517 length:483 start_codon:yes stop_codon:yes gene_type:complete
MCKCVNENYDSFDTGELFANMFDMDTDTEQKIINNYALAYITEQVVCNWLGHTIIKIYKNIFKNQANKNKYSRLISLYDKYITHLNNINKKKTIDKIFINTPLPIELIDKISKISIEVGEKYKYCDKCNKYKFDSYEDCIDTIYGKICVECYEEHYEIKK